ncbi:hypothetical protein EV648_110278 [Kribbella sp. VKM Ac-2568]|nr:hypothetical protein EV648_110278 [Kribbella sp. VKM Ac-2568]
MTNWGSLELRRIRDAGYDEAGDELHRLLD